MKQETQEIKERWHQHIISCKQIDKEAATKGINWLYQEVGKCKPEILFFDSPIALKIAEVYITKMLYTGENIQVEQAVISAFDPINLPVINKTLKLVVPKALKILRSNHYISAITGTTRGDINILEEQRPQKPLAGVENPTSIMLDAIVNAERKISEDIVDKSIRAIITKFLTFIDGDIHQFINKEIYSRNVNYGSEEYKELSEIKNYLMYCASYISGTYGKEYREWLDKYTPSIEITPANDTVLSITDVGWLAMCELLPLVDGPISPDEKDYIRDYMIADRATKKIRHENYRNLILSGVFTTSKLERFCLVSAMPTEIHRDENQILHSDSGPAIKFRDGYEEYLWHGIEVPKEWIMKPTSIKRRTILGLKKRYRMVVREIIGADKYDAMGISDKEEEPEATIKGD